jgi:hypothetical protein
MQRVIVASDHTQWQTHKYTLGRTPLYGGLALAESYICTTHTVSKWQTSMPPAGLEPTIPASKRQLRSAIYYLHSKQRFSVPAGVKRKPTTVQILYSSHEVITGGQRHVAIHHGGTVYNQYTCYATGCTDFVLICNILLIIIVRNMLCCFDSVRYVQYNTLLTVKS